MKQALDLGYLRVAIPPCAYMYLSMLYFQGNVFDVQNWLNGYE